MSRRTFESTRTMRSVLATRRGHDFVGRQPRGRAALGVLEPLRKSHLGFAFCRTDDCRIALRKEFHVGPRQKMEPLTDFLRNADLAFDLAFGRDLHNRNHACELRFPQAEKKKPPRFPKAALVRICVWLT